MPPPVYETGSRRRTEPRASEPPAATKPASPPLDPPPSKYSLVAYKDHTVYSVDSWWIEEETLHYVTTEKTHNQASVDLIDFNLMSRLNAH